MKLSQTEHNIKKNLADREIEPSAALWERIQGELDERETSNSNKGLWFKLSAVAAVLCLCFLAYQGFHNTRETIPTLVLQQKGTIEQSIEFNTQTIDYVVVPKLKKINNKLITAQLSEELETELPQASEEVLVVDQSSTPIEDEVQALLQNANRKLSKTEQDKVLMVEVDNLLDQAIGNTQDVEQQEILKSMQARLLLAEVEADIELTKPPNLKDKIWEAIVSNYSDLKNSVVLN